MRAARVRGGRTHYVYDNVSTYCGRQLIDMPVTQELEEAALPAGEAICAPCAAIAASDALAEPAPRVTLPPSYGIWRTTGPLYHGFKRTRGQQVLRGEEW